MNLAALSNAVNASHEFLAGYAFQHGLGQPVSEIQAAAALDCDQLVMQAVAAREEEVSHFQKLGPLLQVKIQFFVKGDGATRVCHGQPSEPLSSVLELSSGFFACLLGSALIFDCLLKLFFFLIAQFVSIRDLKGVVLWTFQGSGSVAFVEQFGVGQQGTNATNVAAAQCQQLFTRSSTYLDPQGTVGGLPQGFPGSSPLNQGMVHGPLRRGPPPKRSPPLPPPTSRRGPTASPKPPPGAGTGYVRFDEGPLVHPPAPTSAQPVNQVLSPGPPASCATPLPVGPVVDSVADQLRALELLSSFMDPPEVEALRSRLVPHPCACPF